MPETDDIALLKEYAESGSEAAFTALVGRHVNLVYSAALRGAGNAHAAQEIAQTVFIILARKAGQLSRHTVLSGWLYQTARLTAANYLRGEIRRQHREQEAYMQSILDQPEGEAWRQIAPLLDDAMGRLGEKDRNAIVLRFFENKNLSEVGAALGASEDAAKMRVNRALEKLRKFFTKRGVTLSGAIIAGAVSANSVQAAPVALAKTISAIAIAKGVAASASTLTLIKGALKIMAWTKAKTAVAASAVVLLVAGTTTVTVKEIQRRADLEWDIGRVDGRILQTAPHIVRIIPSRFPKQGGWAGNSDGRVLGLGLPIEAIIGAVYGDPVGARTIFPAKLPEGKYDLIANLTSGSSQALKQEIEKQFGITAQRQTMETNVYFLRVKTKDAPGLRSTTTQNNSSSSQSLGGISCCERAVFQCRKFPGGKIWNSRY